MKASFQHLGFNTVEESFLCFWVRSPQFGFHWHYHPEYEITYVVKGRGTRLVGDHMAEFEAGDMVLLGSNLPHTWISEDALKPPGMEVVVLQFPQQLFDFKGAHLTELNSIQYLLASASRGLKFDPDMQRLVGPQLMQLVDLKGIYRYTKLLELLDQLAQNLGVPLASEVYSPTRSRVSEQRIGDVCTYIHENFTEAIEIAQLADLASMSEAAFCRFFKKMTGKSALTYVNDLRIGKACTLLSDNSVSISEAAYNAGFNSLTHFNRSFLKRRGKTPTDYRKMFEL